MEESPSVQQFLPKKHWYKTWWGEMMLVVFLFVVMGVFFFMGAVAMEVKKIQNTRNVADLSGDGAITLSTNIQPVSDAAPQTAYLENAAMTLGSPKAELTIVEFADFGCPYSEEASHTMREMAAKYPLRFHYVFRDFPNTELHPNAELAANAARCAAEQGKFWEYHDKLFANQGAQNADALMQYAIEVGLDSDKFVACVGARKYAKEVQADFEFGVKAGLRGTPTFFLNDHKAEGPLPPEKLEALLLKLAEHPEK